MSKGTVLTLGIGAFTGGGAKFIPTLGYGTGGTPPPPDVSTPTGGKGDNEAKPTTYKPTGLLGRRKKVPEGRKDVEERVDQAREIEAEIAGQLARERGEPVPELLPPISEMSLAEIDAEIRTLLLKRMRSEEDEMMLLMLMIAAAG